MSDVIAPPVCGMRNVRQSGGGKAERWGGGGRRGGGEVEAGGALRRRGVVEAPWQRPRWLSASGPKRAMPVSVSVSGCQK